MGSDGHDADAPYEAPKLVRHGKVAEITQSGLGTGADYIDSSMRPGDTAKGDGPDPDPPPPPKPGGDGGGN